VDCLNFFVKHVSAISQRRASPANLIADKESIWFGVIIVMTVELGLIHPPVGMNVFVIKSVVQEVTFSTIFRGVMPFIATDLIRLIILISFPILALWLPSHM
jgi:C4-dicarboxylate transporter, DctM subunit